MKYHDKHISSRVTNHAVEKLHDQCRRNKSLLIRAENAGCFSCCKIFHPKEIKEWVDLGGTTALCPHCGIDAVLPHFGQFPLEKKFLEKMYEYFFCYSMPMSEVEPRRKAWYRELEEFAGIKGKRDSKK